MTDGLTPSAVDFLDLDLAGREVSAPLDELYQDLIHRLFEAPGSNIDDPHNRGVGIEDLLSSGFAQGTNAAPSQTIARRIEVDFRKDLRVQQVSASVVRASEGVYRIEIAVVADEKQLGITLEANGNGVRVVT